MKLNFVKSHTLLSFWWNGLQLACAGEREKEYVELGRGEEREGENGFDIYQLNGTLLTLGRRGTPPVPSPPHSDRATDGKRPRNIHPSTPQHLCSIVAGLPDLAMQFIICVLAHLSKLACATKLGAAALWYQQHAIIKKAPPKMWHPCRPRRGCPRSRGQKGTTEERKGDDYDHHSVEM